MSTPSSGTTQGSEIGSSTTSRPSAFAGCRRTVAIHNLRDWGRVSPHRALAAFPSVGLLPGSLSGLAFDLLLDFERLGGIVFGARPSSQLDGHFQGAYQGEA